MESRYAIEHKAPDIEDYLRLRQVTGLTPKTAEQAAPIFDNTWLWVRVINQDSGQTVAMGRVIGDGGWCFLIADMATDPEHQRQGIGRAVLGELLNGILKVAPDNPYIVLLADAPGRPLYESMGFVETAPRSIGMRYAPNEVGTES
ncbi:MAG: GNAT family N-acetyltransferase [Corynebacterium sp.]|uniref:GNAT family N-acetyltransferase n=1 Tax=Corynebacterium sp. TaxID=1720 RepID=UPI0018196D35|nr:GNAT family N-acetyltransferase [Corynebacterium sp.]NWO17973.1 GNAT family N-acetyltransferase [Corynebacterium sp.]